MTDTARVNNIYYDMNVYNPTSIPIKAEIDNKLLFPLLNQADQFSVSLAKAKVPLDSIPLTRSNLPLKLYQLGLKIGTTEELAYVRQVNANQDNFLWNCPKNSTVITKYKYSSTGILTQISSEDIQLLVQNVYNFVVDDFQNYFVVGSDSLSEVPNKVYAISSDGILLQTLEFVHVKHIYIDRGQNLYICDEAPTPMVYIYGMLNTEGQVNITEKATLKTNQAGDPLSNLLFCVADGEIIVGYNQNTVTLYNAQYEPQTDIVESAIKQLQNLANINSPANTYILSNSDQIDDDIYGTKNNVVYRVIDDAQYTLGNIESPYAITLDGNGWGTGLNNYLYKTPYPVNTPPAEYTQANSITTIRNGCLWSAQKTNQLFGLGLTYLYYCWNYNNLTPTNQWASLGEFKISANPTPTPINVDIQSTTNKIFLVGNDNNLYVSRNPTAQMELIFNNLVGNYPTNSFTWGLRQWNVNGNQQNSLLNNFSVWNSDIVAMFKQGYRWFVAFEVQGVCTLNIYSVFDNSLISTHPNLDTGFTGMTYLDGFALFAYQNSSQSIVMRNVSTLAVVYTIPNIGILANAICELGSNHIAVCEAGIDNNIYIYSIQSLTLVNTVTLLNNVNVCDITSNRNDISNGAVSLFVVGQTQQNNLALGQQIYKITFTDNTYILTAAQNLIYTTDRNIAQINVHESISSIVFIEGDLTFSNYNNLSIKSLFQNASYSTNNMVTANMPNQPFMVNQWIPYKGTVYLSPTTSMTQKWTQVTSNLPLKAVTVSRSNPNKLYGLGSVDGLIYQGNVSNNAITFTQIAEFTQTYDYLSNTQNTAQTLSSKLYLYGLQSQNLITSLDLQDECGAIARNDVNNQYMVSYKTQNKVQALNAETLALQFTSSLTGAYRIFTKNGSDIDAGTVDIYNMSVLIDAINNAFTEATTKINQALGAGTIGTAPSLSLDYQTGLCTLSYPQTLTLSGNGILFNQSLLNIVYFTSTLDQQYQLYKLTLNTQQETTTQHVKTINKFNKLDKILFRSNTIYVVGAYFGINDSNNIFFDIDCPTTDWIENIDQTIYFQPNFLRTYFLRSNLSLDDIQIQLYYEYKDGTSYELYINNGENVSLKLQFIQKF